MRSAIQWAVDYLYRQFPRAHFKVETINTLDHSDVSRISVSDTIERSYIIKSGNDPLMYREFIFYRELSQLLPNGICPKCFFSVEIDGVWAVLLEDLEGTVTEAHTYPSEARIEQFVLALGKLHRHAQTIEDLHDLWATSFTKDTYNTVQGRTKVLQARVDSFLVTEMLDPESFALVKRLPGLAGLIQSFYPETIIHGDAHFGNAIFKEGEARLIDWGNTALGIGEIDIAHAIALNLPRDYSGRIEEGVIHFYANYVGQDIGKTWKRYKIGVLYAVASSLGMREFGVPNWEILFENAIRAALDLNAVQLIPQTGT